MLHAGTRPALRVYASSETHTWMQKAADLFGLGTDAVRWIPTDARPRMDVAALRRADRRRPRRRRSCRSWSSAPPAPSAPARSTRCAGIAEICREHELWFHVDGGVRRLRGRAARRAARTCTRSREADSIAVDPHKWLYAPLEAGCVLVRDPARAARRVLLPPALLPLRASDGRSTTTITGRRTRAASARSRSGWRCGRSGGAGYVRMIADDMRLARALHARRRGAPRARGDDAGLSITTFRYVPRRSAAAGRRGRRGGVPRRAQRALLDRAADGAARRSSRNAVVARPLVLRACIVNFRTTLADVDGAPRDRHPPRTRGRRLAASELDRRSGTRPTLNESPRAVPRSERSRVPKPPRAASGLVELSRFVHWVCASCEQSRDLVSSEPPSPLSAFDSCATLACPRTPSPRREAVEACRKTGAAPCWGRSFGRRSSSRLPGSLSACRPGPAGCVWPRRLSFSCSGSDVRKAAPTAPPRPPMSAQAVPRAAPPSLPGRDSRHRRSSRSSTSCAPVSRSDVARAVRPARRRSRLPPRASARAPRPTAAVSSTAGLPSRWRSTPAGRPTRTAAIR